MKVDVSDFRLKLYPKDFYAVRSFYENDLGLTVTKEWDRGENDKGVMFQVGTTTLELLSPEGDYKPVTGADVSWQVENVEEMWRAWKLESNIIFPLRDNEWGDSSFCISDPEGFKITFFTKR